MVVESKRRNTLGKEFLDVQRLQKRLHLFQTANASASASSKFSAHEQAKVLLEIEGGADTTKDSSMEYADVYVEPIPVLQPMEPLRGSGARVNIDNLLS